MYNDPIQVRLRANHKGVFVPVSLWRELNVDGAVQQGGGAIEPALHTRSKGQLPCAMPSLSDSALGRGPAVHSTLYDAHATQAALLSHPGACSDASAELAASTFGIGYGSPVLERLYGHGVRRNVSLLISRDGKQAALVVGKDLTELQHSASVFAASFQESEADGSRRMHVTALNGTDLTFGFTLEIDTSLTDAFATYVPHLSEGMANAEHMPFSIAFKSSSRAKRDPVIAFNTHPDPHRAAVSKSRRTVLGLGFCIGKCITFDDENHIVYIQNVEDATPMLPYMKRKAVRKAKRVQEVGEAMLKREAAEDEERALYKTKRGGRIEPNIKGGIRLPGARNAAAEIAAKLASDRCARYTKRDSCLSTPDENCAWDADESECRESFWQSKAATMLLLTIVPLGYFVLYRYMGKRATFWSSFPPVIFKAYAACGAVAVLSVCILLLLIHLSNSREPYQRAYTYPTVCLAVGAAAAPAVLGLSLKYGISLGWMFPFTILSGYAAVRLAKQELQVVNPQLYYYELFPAYFLLFHFIFTDGMLWWMLLILSR
jgi:hypothetical protein